MSLSPNQSRNLTAADLSSHLGPVAGRGGINVAFFYARVIQRTKDGTRNGVPRDQLFVAKQPKGDRYTVAHRKITPEQAAHQFPEQYARFVQYEDVPTHGTPLHDLPGIAQSEIALLVLHGLRCIEDLREVSDEQAGLIGFGVARARKLALAWLDKRDGAAATIVAAGDAARQSAENEALRRRLDALERRNIELETVLKAGGSRSAGPHEVAPPPGTVPLTLDEGDGFLGGGGGVVDGNDDLGGEPDDPLRD